MGNGITYLSHGDSESKGVAILMSGNFECEVNKSIIDPNGRYIILDAQINEVRTLIVNIYAPNDDDIEFFKTVINKIKLEECDNVIWGGDFNLVFDIPMDKKGGAQTTHFKCRQVLMEWMSEASIVDIWRRQHTHEKKYTWFSNRRPAQYKKKGGKDTEYEYIACRLDFFLVPFHMIQSVRNNNIIAGYHSDHSAINLTVDIRLVDRGRGFWKMNCSFLENNDYIAAIKESIKNSVIENPDTEEQILWEQIKCNVRRDTITFSCRQNRKRKNSLETLENEKIRLLNMFADGHSPAQVARLQEVNSEIDQILEYQSKGAAIRSRAQYYEEGEKSTKFFYGLETARLNSKNITKLVDSKGKMVEGLRNVLIEEKEITFTKYTALN